MISNRDQRSPVCHVVAMPYPGRGHINPMMTLCKLLTSQKTDILITFVVTEEWFGFIGSEVTQDNIRLATIPNVVPSELVRAADKYCFIEAIMTKMEAPFERLMDRLEPPPSLIVADTFLPWAVRVGNRRSIPAASFWPMPASFFSVFQHFHLLAENGHFPVDLLERGNERVDYIPGVSSTRLADLPHFISGISPNILHHIHEDFSWVPKAQYLLFPSIYELEPQVIDVLRSIFSLPIYTIGPLIPYIKSNYHPSAGIDYLQWLDSQPCSSVLYISMGSFLSFSGAQMDEIAGDLRLSRVRFIWVACGETDRLKDACGDMGLVVPWCEQLRVLCDSSVGGFLTHCGWNSVREGVFAGVPFLTFPLRMDQGMVSKMIVEDWKVGWRLRKAEDKMDHLVTTEEIAGLAQKFMDLEDDEGREMRRRARELKQICHGAIEEGGSSQTNINAFVGDIFQGHA
ncbi:UDP-glycosyltransferase 87A1-like [Pyrus communis]|uniref:UDP-glycosyltransferase 87A1-like n=1 Tax=Pyrus communis TaxID=23211 RepID=UPI0035C2209A